MKKSKKLTKEESFKKFFAITTATFNFLDKITTILDKPNTSESYLKMKMLHELASDEMNKDKPDMKLIEAYIAKMNMLVTKPHPRLEFAKGGIIVKPKI